MLSRLVVKVPPHLGEKIAEAANAADMLPSEWVRNLIRESFGAKGEPDV